MAATSSGVGHRVAQRRPRVGSRRAAGPTRQAGLSAFGSSAATRAASDGEPARRASSSLRSSTATCRTEVTSTQPDRRAHLRADDHARPVPAPERQVDARRPGSPAARLGRIIMRRASVLAERAAASQAVSTQAPNFQPTSCSTPTCGEPARAVQRLAGRVGQRDHGDGHVDAVGAEQPEQLVVQPPAVALLLRVEAEVDRRPRASARTPTGGGTPTTRRSHGPRRPRRPRPAGARPGVRSAPTLPAQRSGPGRLVVERRQPTMRAWWS